MTWLLDASAFRMHEPQVSAVLEPRMSMFHVATCGPTVLELLYSTREAADLPGVRRFWTEVNPYIGLDERHVTRALDVAMALAAHRPSLHRVVKYVDLLVAAVAERSGLTVLHYDDDFDKIAEVTGQPTEWVVPRGSLSR